jgi:hypothetical protein
MAFGIRILGVLAVMLLSQPALACINSIGTNHHGHRFAPGNYTGDELVESLMWAADRKYLDQEARRLATAVRTAPDFASLNDLGVVLIRYGRNVEAIRLFLSNERRLPGHAETAANLGTALELAGFDEVALKWIRIGVRRNAAEHWGTEWLHVRILEAKIALKRDPAYLDGRSVAGIAFDDALIPAMPARYPNGNDGRPVLAYQLDQALHYQLRERLQFVKPEDRVVANLMTDWATLNLAGGPVESAEALYALAERYGAPRTALVTARRAQIRKILASAKDRREPAAGTCMICEPPPPPPPQPPMPRFRL